MTTSIELYVDAPHTPELHHIATLTGAAPDITERYTGTRRYLAGTVSAIAETLRPIYPLITAGLGRTFFVHIDGEYVRVLHLDASQLGGTVVLTVDQSRLVLVHDPQQNPREGGLIGRQLRVVEPSPPRPRAEWFVAEKQRALADWETEQAMAAAVNDVFTHPTSTED